MYSSKLEKVKNGYSDNLGKTNRRLCRCSICNEHIQKGFATAFVGGYNGGGYICQYCFNETEEKQTTKGTEKANGFFVSPSFDAYYINDDISNYLKSLGYTIENNTFKGVTYSGIKGLSTILKRLDKEDINIISSDIIINKSGLDNGYILNNNIIKMLINNKIVNDIRLENNNLYLSCNYKNKNDYFNKLRIYQKIVNIIISNKNIDYKLKREVSKHI